VAFNQNIHDFFGSKETRKIDQRNQAEMHIFVNLSLECPHKYFSLALQDAKRVNSERKNYFFPFLFTLQRPEQDQRSHTLTP